MQSNNVVLGKLTKVKRFSVLLKISMISKAQSVSQSDVLDFKRK